MSTPVGTITRAATRSPDEPLNILTFPTHERYESSLAQTGHRFWAMRGNGIKDWKSEYAPLPENYVLLNPAQGERQIPAEVDFDLILAQSVGHMAAALPISQKLHLPLVRLEHTLPFPAWKHAELNYFRALRGHMLVTVSAFNRDAWRFPQETRIIHHGIDTDFWTPDPSGEKKGHALSVVNDFVNRDWCCGYSLWRKVVADVPYHLVGDTKGLSEPAKDVEELRSFYRQAPVFLNTTLVSSAPVSPLEAMACGCAVVSTATTTMPDVIEHGVNGFLSDDPKALAGYCRMLLEDLELCRKIGEAGRRTVVERFSVPRFVQEWRELFSYAANITYTGKP